MKNLPEKEMRYLILAATVVLVFLAIFLLYYYVFPAAWSLINQIIPLTLPFIIALVLVGLLEPIIRPLEKKWRVSRTPLILLAIILFVVAIIGIISWLVYMLVVELIRFSNDFPQYASNFNERIAELQNIFAAGNISPQLMELINEYTAYALTAIGDLSLGLLNYFIDLAAVLPMAILVFMFAIIAVFFISRDQEIILKSFEKYLPATIYRRMTLVGSATGGALFGYLKSQLILMFIAAGIAFIGLQILGVPYAFLIAVLVGIADLLPLVGPGTIFLPWIVWELVNGNYGFAIALLVVYAVVTVVRQVVQPKIVGDSIGLHPLETLIALFVGLRLMGVLGLILGPIIWVVFKASWNAGVFKRDC